MKLSLFALTAFCCLPALAHPGHEKATAPLAALAPHSKPAQKIVVHLSDSESSNALHSAFMAIGLATGLEKWALM